MGSQRQIQIEARWRHREAPAFSRGCPAWCCARFCWPAVSGRCHADGNLGANIPARDHQLPQERAPLPRPYSDLAPAAPSGRAVAAL